MKGRFTKSDERKQFNKERYDAARAGKGTPSWENYIRKYGIEPTDSTDKMYQYDGYDEYDDYYDGYNSSTYERNDATDSTNTEGNVDTAGGTQTQQSTGETKAPQSAEENPNGQGTEETQTPQSSGETTDDQSIRKTNLEIQNGVKTQRAKVNGPEKEMGVQKFVKAFEIKDLNDLELKYKTARLAEAVRDNGGKINDKLYKEYNLTKQQYRDTWNSFVPNNIEALSQSNDLNTYITNRVAVFKKNYDRLINKYGKEGKGSLPFYVNYLSNKRKK